MEETIEGRTIKIAVTGGAGQIGYSLLFRIASGEMFGAATKIDLSLLELPSALDSLRGVVMELEDCAFPLIQSVSISSNPLTAFQDVDWALLVGSVPRTKGMERKDLLKINGDIFVEQGNALLQSAKKECKVLVVGNPCNTNAFIVKEIAKNIPEKNFFALTFLDQNRAYSQLAKKAGVHVSDIQNLAIWGNHSATQFPDFFNAKICGNTTPNMIKDIDWLKKIFIKTVQQRGSEIIKMRGFSSAASAANATVDTIRNLTTKTKEGSFFSVAVCSDGSYGIEKGLIFSFPIRSTGTNWEIVQGIKHNDYSIEKIKETQRELIFERETIKNLLNEDGEHKIYQKNLSF